MNAEWECRVRNGKVNSAFRNPYSAIVSAAHVRQQRHEPRPLDRLSHGMLARGVAARLAAAHDAAVTVGQLAQQIEILVINEHRARTDAVDPDGISLRDATEGGGLALWDHGSQKIGSTWGGLNW